MSLGVEGQSDRDEIEREVGALSETSVEVEIREIECDEMSLKVETEDWKRRTHHREAAHQLQHHQFDLQEQ